MGNLLFPNLTFCRDQLGNIVADSIMRGVREDDALAGIGITRVLVRVFTSVYVKYNLPANPLLFIARTRLPIPNQPQQPYE